MVYITVNTFLHSELQCIPLKVPLCPETEINNESLQRIECKLYCNISYYIYILSFFVNNYNYHNGL